MSLIIDNKYATKYEYGRTRLLESLFPPGPGRALDLGCGSGFFTQRLVEHGWEVTSVDTEAQNVAQARRYTETAIVDDACSFLAKDYGKFDFAIALEIIEHLDRPNELLTLLRAKCDRLLLSTPNRLSPEGLGGYYWGEKIRRWGRWKAWDETHRFIFSSPELLRELRKAEWQPERVIGYWYEGFLPFGIKWRIPIETSDRYPLNGFGFNIIVSCRAAKIDSV